MKYTYIPIGIKREVIWYGLQPERVNCWVCWKRTSGHSYFSGQNCEHIYCYRGCVWEIRVWDSMIYIHMVQLVSSIKSSSYLVYTIHTLKVVERYEKWLWVSSSVKGKSLPAPPSGKEWAIDGQNRRGLNESQDKDSPSTKCQQPSRKTDERVEVRATSCP